MFPDWMSKGKCRTARDPEWFYPRQDNEHHYRHARELCSICPVMVQCREYALATRDPYGMWGNTTPRERNAILAGREYATEYGGFHGDAPGTVRGYYREKRCGEKPCPECRQAYNESTNKRLKAARKARNGQEQAA